MILRFYLTYVNSYKGFRKEVWLLALITLINRAGSMVIPFLSLYLTKDLGFSLKQVGIIMAIFGISSAVGSFIGGKATDKLGFYPVIILSLVSSGLSFIFIQYLESFLSLCIGIFVLMLINDSFRPAAYVAINAYSKPENRTRAVTLIRLAINLGFSVGPALGGIIITKLSYNGLFWVDGMTCIAAGLLFFYLLDRKQAKKDAESQISKNRMSPYRDIPYLLFILIVFLIAFSFLQLFSTIPLYFRDIHLLTEEQIGYLMAMNGLIIFFTEMPLIKYLERPKFSIFRILTISTLLIAASFFVLNLSSLNFILIVSILLITVGEMTNFPFLNRFALNRAEKGRSGDYMALFTMAFSFGHIVGPYAGMKLVDLYSYNVAWYSITGVLVLASFFVLILKRVIQKEAFD